MDGLSFGIEAGEIFALLGPNGAGKTTMVRLLMGLLEPDSGSIHYHLDERGAAWPPSSRLGYLPEDRGLYRDLPILHTLTYFGVLRDMEDSAAENAAKRWLERLGLGDRVMDKLAALSKGNQQKVQFAAAVLHRPAFAVLDEPFSGLDPVNQELFLDLIRELRDQGMTILLSAHQMNLVERLADRMLLMNRGREVLSGSLDEIRRSTLGAQRLRLRVEGLPDLGPIRSHPDVVEVSQESSGEVVISYGAETPLIRILTMVSAHLPVTGVVSEEASLHDIYVQAVGADALLLEADEPAEDFQ